MAARRNVKRSYGQYCALARALDVVGERWTLLVVRELMLGPRRFTDLEDGLPGIGPSLLAERLRSLESEGLVRRDVLPPPAASRVYELTHDGRELARALAPLVAWGAKRLAAREPDELFNPEWFFLALRGTFFEPRKARGVKATVDFHIDEHTFHVGVDNRKLLTGLGPASPPADATVTTDLATFMGTANGTIDPAEAAASGRAVVAGDATAVAQLLGALR